MFLCGAVQHDGDEAAVPSDLIILHHHQLVDVVSVELFVAGRLSDL